MLCQFDLNTYWNENVQPRKQLAQAKLRSVLTILSDLLHHVVKGFLDFQLNSRVFESLKSWIRLNLKNNF